MLAMALASINLESIFVNTCDRFVLDASTDAPPSFRPAKKYSDLSGLPVSFN